MVDAAAVIKICNIYDWDGKGELDLFYLGDVLYALGINTTKMCDDLGQTDEEGKMFAKFDEIVEKVNDAKNANDSSCTYQDYVQFLKLYEKYRNGTLMLACLQNILANLGVELHMDDVSRLMLDICDTEDEEG